MKNKIPINDVMLGGVLDCFGLYIHQTWQLCDKCQMLDECVEANMGVDEEGDIIPMIIGSIQEIEKYLCQLMYK